MALGTSPAAGVFLSRSINSRAWQMHNPRLLGTIASAQLVVAGLLILSVLPVMEGATLAAATSIAPNTSALQLICFAISVALGCALALVKPQLSISQSQASYMSWAAILERTTDTLPAPDRQAAAAAIWRLNPDTDTARTSKSSLHPRFDFDPARGGLSGATIARGLADAWTRLWGHQLFTGAFEIEAYRGRVSCDPTVLRQSVMHLLTAAAADNTYCGSWQISVRCQHGERAAVIHGRTSASQYDRVLAKQIETGFAITMAEALLRQQMGSLTITRDKSGCWTATISLPQA